MLSKHAEMIKELVQAAELVPIEGADHDFVVAETYHDPVRKAVPKFPNCKSFGDI